MLGELEIISRVELTVLQHIFRSHRSTWFPMLTAHRFSEFDTCNLPCRAYTLFRLVSSSCKICFKAQSVGSKGKKIKVFCENNAYFDSILAFIVTPGPNI